jgi:glycosyltransferase involved in cell wall biosynthesis
MLIARLEPENNIETILEGFSRSTVERQMIVVGNVNTKYGQYIQAKYSDDRINYIGYVSGIEKLDSLRYYSNIYFHGHTVGGTNPSLLEAMASNALICAHNNVFNKAILGEDALYFDKADDIVKVLEESQKELVQSELVNNTKKIDSLYSWPCIIEQYEDFLLSCLKNR